MVSLQNFSFGTTSAVMTSLAIVMGLSSSDHAKMTIISALIIIAVADNISDSFGIHVHTEAEKKSPKEVRMATLQNFTARFFVTVVFIAFMLLLPIIWAVIASIIFGLVVIIVLSYFIAMHQKISPYKAILQHAGLAAAVLIGSFFLRQFIQGFI